MNLAKSERAALCDLFDQVGPDAPTLCDGWTTSDLAAHLWVRENDPLAMPGIALKPLAGLTDKRMEQATTRWSFPDLVERIRRGPAPLSLFGLPGVDEPANATEYFVHHEDVRRAGEVAEPPRELGAEAEEWMWKRLRLLGRAFFRSCPDGVVLERDTDGDTLRVAPGQETVTLVGKPSELLLFGFGRTRAAEVRQVGEPGALARFAAVKLGF